MADQTKTPPKRRGFHKVVAKDDDTNETQSDGRPPPKKDLDLKVSSGTKPSPATTSGAQTDSKPPPKASPITHKTETPKVETTQPPKVETTQPPKVETTQPPKVETTQPPKVETTQPPKVETTQPPPNTVTEPASAVVRSKPEAVSVCKFLTSHSGGHSVFARGFFVIFNIWRQIQFQFRRAFCNLRGVSIS